MGKSLSRRQVLSEITDTGLLAKRQNSSSRPHQSISDNHHQISTFQRHYSHLWTISDVPTSSQKCHTITIFKLETDRARWHSMRRFINNEKPETPGDLYDVGLKGDCQKSLPNLNSVTCDQPEETLMSSPNFCSYVTSPITHLVQATVIPYSECMTIQVSIIPSIREEIREITDETICFGASNDEDMLEQRLLDLETLLHLNLNLYRSQSARSKILFATHRRSHTVDWNEKFKSQALPREVIQFEKQIGEGMCGKVFKCKIYETPYVCKVINQRDFPEAKKKILEDEISALFALQGHKNIVKLHDVYMDFDDVFLIFEDCKGGDLFNRIKQRRFFIETEAASISRSIGLALKYCHDNGVMHRDLKPENIFLASVHNDLDIRLGDFGSSTFFSPGEKFCEVVGSPLYVAPSVLKRNYGPEIDVWSLGIIVYTLLCGRPPFMATKNIDDPVLENDEVFQKILEDEPDFSFGRWRYVSSQAKDLVKGLLKKDDAARLTLEEFLAHPWIANACQCVGPKDDEVPIATPLAADRSGFVSRNDLKLYN